MKIRFLLLGLTLFLSACGRAQAPVISFIGVGTGTLQTGLQHIQFSQTFQPTDTQIIAAVAFQSIESGSTVQATWFSPDERQMPLGRTSIVIGSGAKIARFSFASREPWAAAPYLLRIDAMTGQGEGMLTATGSLPFFIGMTDDEIRIYQREFAEWTKAENEQRAMWDQQEQAKKKFLDDAKKSLGFSAITVVANIDVNGDGSMDYVLSNQEDTGMPPGGGGGPGVLVSSNFQQGAVMTSSGQVLLSLLENGKTRIIRTGSRTLLEGIPKQGDVLMTILPSFTLSLSWKDKDTDCFAEFTPESSGYALLQQRCR